jgi:type IV pilus assembly protein PilO
MMDFKDPKTQKWMLGVLMAALTAYFWHAKVYKANQQELSSGYARYETMQTELKNVEMKFRSLDALRREYQDLTQKYRAVATLLPEDDQLAALLEKVHGAALETSSRVASFEPLPAVSEGFYDRYDFKMVLHTTYHDLGDFMARMSNLPFIVNTGEVHMITVSEQDNPETAYGGFTTTVTMTISTYQVKEAERIVLAGL